MAPWFHSVVLATTLVATVAVGVASASFFIGAQQAAPKGDRLPIVADASRYMTVETRDAANLSVLHRVQID
jgi:MFS superfamily sulfate permease-like transporter